jgi:rhodanese-related sulfurtransferase
MKVTHLNVQEAHKLMQERPDMAILDVRTDEEFEMSFIKGAINFDALEDGFEAQLKTLDVSQNYLIHCHSGQRALDALPKFKALGFSHIYVMDGGMREWMHAELPHIYNYYI